MLSTRLSDEESNLIFKEKLNSYAKQFDQHFHFSYLKKENNQVDDI